MLKAGLRRAMAASSKALGPQPVGTAVGFSSWGAKNSTATGLSKAAKSTASGLSKGVLAAAKRPGYSAAGLGAGVGIAALVTSSGRSSDPRAPMGNSAGLYKY